jgi:mono/diheme cytochrome c family protein
MTGARVVGGAVLAYLAALGCGLAYAAEPPPYTVEQAARGEQLYRDHCANCHGAQLSKGPTNAPALKGVAFKAKWGDRLASELFVYLSQAMPPGLVAKMVPDEYADVMAFLFQVNGLAAGPKPLSSDTDDLETWTIPYAAGP